MEMDKAPGTVEVWRNVAKGMRWYTRFDPAGRETSGKVMGGKTFTVTPFERQLNQEKAATSELDAFRNGTFVLVRAAEETIKDEIESPDSLSKNEIESIVHQLLAAPGDLPSILEDISSATTLDRLKEYMIAYGLDVTKVEEKYYEVTGETAPVRRRIIGETAVATAPAE